MQSMKSWRVLVATFVATGVAASPALASGGPIDHRSPDAKDAAAAITAARTVDRRSPDVQDVASRPDTRGSARAGATDLRTTASLAGPPRPVDVNPGPPQFPTHTVPLAAPPKPVSVAPAGDGFDVDDAVIGAGGAAVLFVAVAGGLAVSRRRRLATAA